MFSPFDHERLLLGHILVYGEEAAKYVLPKLTHEKLVYSKEGQIGLAPDHMRIWQAITLCYLKEKMPPTIPNVLRCLEGKEDYRSYLISLEQVLSGYYRVREFDPRYVVGLADTVDRNGVIYRIASRAEQIGQIVETPEAFEKFVSGIQDVDAWVNDQLNRFRDVVRPSVEGYQHISTTMAATREKWERVLRGEQMTLLPTGMPSLYNRGLFPAGKLVIVQGESNAGKSAFVHLVNMGVAIGLYSNNIKGCVAINSMEESPDALNTKLAGILAKVNTWKFMMFGKDGISDEEYRRLCYWSDFITELPIYVDHTNFLKTSVQEFRLSGLHTSDKGPIWQMSSDYLELFDPSDSGITDSKERQLDYIVHRHFEATRQLGCSIIDISQVTQGDGMNKHRVAGAGGARYSKSIRHAADIVIELLNYGELERAGINAEPMPGMNKEQVFGLIEKYRDGPKSKFFTLNWEPEYVRMSDNELTFGLSENEWKLFDHLGDAESIFYQQRKVGF